jgi:hypothetical protein
MVTGEGAEKHGVVSLVHIPTGRVLFPADDGSSPSLAAPVVLTYDERSRSLVGFNPYDLRLSTHACRPWEASIVPLHEHKGCALASSDEPWLRLREEGHLPPSVASVLLQLQRLAQPLGDLGASGADSAPRQGEVELTSGSSYDGNMAELRINGQRFGFDDAGYHVVLLDEQGRVTSAKCFALHKALRGQSPGDPGAANGRGAALEALRQLPAGRVALVLKKGGGELKEEDAEGLAGLGLSKRALEKVDKHESFVCLGCKGAPPDSALVVRRGPRQGKAVLRARLPLTTQAYVLEPSGEGLRLLVDMASQHVGCGEDTAVALETALSLLALNLGRFLAATGRQDVVRTVCGDSGLLKAIIGLACRLLETYVRCDSSPTARQAGHIVPGITALLEELLSFDVMSWLLNSSAGVHVEPLLALLSDLAFMHELQRVQGPTKIGAEASRLQRVVTGAHERLMQVRLSRAAVGQDPGGLVDALSQLCERLKRLIDEASNAVASSSESAGSVLEVLTLSPTLELVASGFSAAMPSVKPSADPSGPLPLMAGKVLELSQATQRVIMALNLSPPGGAASQQALVELDRLLATSFLTVAARRFSAVAVVAEKEEALDAWASLLAPVDAASDAPTASSHGEAPTDAKGLLLYLATRAALEQPAESHISQRFLAALRKGGVFWHSKAGPYVLQAGFAAAVCLVKHLGLADEALDLAMGKANAPSKALQQAWRTGVQAMHSFLLMGDGIPENGADAEKDEEEEKEQRRACSLHVARAKFLLEHMPPRGPHAADSSKAVLEFVKAGEVGDVEEVCKLREERAVARLKGLRGLLQFASSAQTPMARLVVLHTWLQALHGAFAVPHGQRGPRGGKALGSHYLQGVAGCRAATRLALQQCFQELSQVLVGYLREHAETQRDKCPPWAFGWKRHYTCPLPWCVLLYTMRALALDYDRDADADVVRALLEPVRGLRDHPDAEIRGMATDLFKLLLGKADTECMAQHVTGRMGALRAELLQAAVGGGQDGYALDEGMVGPHRLLAHGPIATSNSDFARLLRLPEGETFGTLSLWLYWPGGVTKGTVLAQGCLAPPEEGSEQRGPGVNWYQLSLDGTSEREAHLRFTSTCGAVQLRSQRVVRSHSWTHVAISWSEHQERLELCVDGEADSSCSACSGGCFMQDATYPLVLGRLPPHLKAGSSVITEPSAEATVALVVAVKEHLIAEQVAMICEQDRRRAKALLDAPPTHLPEHDHLLALGMVYELTAHARGTPPPAVGEELQLSTLLDTRDLTSVSFHVCCLRLLQTSLVKAGGALAEADRLATVRRLMLEVGRTLCAQGGAVYREASPSKWAMTQHSAEGALALAQQHLDLLRALAEVDEWAEALKAQMGAALRDSLPALQELACGKFAGMRGERQQGLLLLASTYALVGGAFEGLAVGREAQVQLDGSGKVLEDCTVLGVSRADARAGEGRNGDGYVVLVHSVPERVKQVPSAR